MRRPGCSTRSRWKARRLRACAIEASTRRIGAAGQEDEIGGRCDRTRGRNPLAGESFSRRRARSYLRCGRERALHLARVAKLIARADRFAREELREERAKQHDERTGCAGAVRFRRSAERGHGRLDTDRCGLFPSFIDGAIASVALVDCRPESAYSCLRAVIGSSLAARRAGSTQATAVMSASSAETSARLAGSARR
jgi:hypothetical protein